MNQIENRVTVPLNEWELYRIMSALAQKPERESVDEVLYERLEVFANRLKGYNKTADYNEINYDEIPF